MNPILKIISPPHYEDEDTALRVNRELKESMTKIKTLGGLIPICSNCKKIRNDQGYWQQVEEYMEAHSEADFSHSLCPECGKRL